MSYEDLPGLDIHVSEGVATVALNHPPLNLMDGVLLASIRGFIHGVRDDSAIRVVVFESADPEFFSAHGDMHFLTDPDALPVAMQAFIDAAPNATVPDGINMLEALSIEIRALPQVTIGKIAGFARGGGAEFLTYLDMRFAAIGKSGQAQPETMQGILPGGGGTVNLPRLIGRARALELILGGELVGAELAERYGLINRAIPADELDEFVATLARRIARLRPGIIAAVKTIIDTVAPPAPADAYATELREGYGIFSEEVTAFALKQLAAGVQTREGERDLEDLLRTLQA